MTCAEGRYETLTSSCAGDYEGVTPDWKKERFPVLQQLILLLIDALIVDGIKKGVRNAILTPTRLVSAVCRRNVVDRPKK
jgi:hypothetical protein